MWSEIGSQMMRLFKLRAELTDLKPVAALVRALLHVALVSRSFNMVVFWKTPYCNALKAQYYTQ